MSRHQPRNKISIHSPSYSSASKKSLISWTRKGGHLYYPSPQWSRAPGSSRSHPIFGSTFFFTHFTQRRKNKFSSILGTRSRIFTRIPGIVEYYDNGLEPACLADQERGGLSTNSLNYTLFLCPASMSTQGTGRTAEDSLSIWVVGIKYGQWGTPLDEGGSSRWGEGVPRSGSIVYRKFCGKLDFLQTRAGYSSHPTSIERRFVQ